MSSDVSELKFRFHTENLATVQKGKEKILKKYERCQNSFWDGNTVYCLLSTEIKIKKFSIWVPNPVKCNSKFYLYLFIASDSWYYLTPYLFTINISLNSYISSTG